MDAEGLIGSLVVMAGACGVPILGIACVVLIAFAFIRASKRERERTDALRAFAVRQGLSFTPSDPGLSERLSRFEPFNVGHSREGLNLAAGEVRSGGMRASVLFGDYRYKITTSNGKQTTTVTYIISFVAVRPALALPEDLTVRAEGILDRIGAFMGLDDIDFESSEFSKRFHVKCSDRRLAFDLFDPRMMEFFLQSGPPRVQARDGTLLFDYGIKRWEPAEFEIALGWIDAFLARVPRHLRAARLPESDRAADPVLNPPHPEGGSS